MKACGKRNLVALVKCDFLGKSLSDSHVTKVRVGFSYVAELVLSTIQVFCTPPMGCIVDLHK